MSLRILSLAALAAMPAASVSAATIHGRVLGHDGEPREAAVVQIVDPADGEERSRVDADASGQFTISYDSVGLVGVRFSAPHHASHQLPVLLDADDEVTVEVRLGAYPYVDLSAVEELRLVGEINGWNAGIAIPIQRDVDGVFRKAFELFDGQFAYQILGLVPGRSVAGPMADRFEFDGSGDYRAVIVRDEDLVDLEVDPAALPRGETEARLSIDEAHRVSLALRAPANEIEHRRDRFLWRLDEARGPGREEMIQPLRDEFALDLPDVMARAEAAEGAVRDAYTVSALQCMRLAGDASVDPAYVEEAADRLGPASPYWALAPELLGFVISVKGEGGDAFLEAAARDTRDPEVRLMTYMLGYNRAMRATDQATARAWILRLVEEFPDSREASSAQKFLKELDTELAPGVRAPGFEHADLDGEPLTLAGFHGDVVLLDFWATWCKPCIAEIPNLRAVHERFAADGLHVVSISLDRKPEVLEPFLAEYPMPWRHLYLEGGLEHPIAKAYGVRSIPRPVLVDREGRVAALDGELRGRALVNAVRKAIETPHEHH